jgi:hypothetical protein
MTSFFALLAALLHVPWLAEVFHVAPQALTSGFTAAFCRRRGAPNAGSSAAHTAARPVAPLRPAPARTRMQP